MSKWTDTQTDEAPTDGRTVDGLRDDGANRGTVGGTDGQTDPNGKTSGTNDCIFVGFNQATFYHFISDSQAMT